MGLVHVVREMKLKWLSYFVEFPIIYGIAILLDPSIKKIGLTNMLDYYYNVLNVNFDVTNYVDKCVNTLRELCIVYSSQSGSSSTETSIVSSSGPNKGRRFDNEWNSILFRSRMSSASSPETKDLDD